MTTTIDITHRDHDGESHKFHIVLGSEAEKRCGVAFNPGKNREITRTKLAFAAAMQAVVDQEVIANREAKPNGDAMRCYATAKTQTESAQMFAVKGIVQ